MNNEKFNLGRQIERVLDERRMMKCVLAQKLGVSESTAIHLTKRSKIDVGMLQKIGEVLQYNFFKHYPVEEGKGEGPDKDRIIEEQQGRIAELERQVEEMKGMEMHYLRMSNEQLRESQRMLAASLRMGAAQKGKEKKKDMLFG